MKFYKHKIVNEGFENLFDSSTVDLADQFEKSDIRFRTTQITDWMTECVKNSSFGGRPGLPNRRWKLNGNYEIPAVNGWITFTFTNNETSYLTENGEIPDFIKIGKISHTLHIENYAGENGIRLTSFKNFPKIVQKSIEFNTDEKLTTLKDIPVIDLNVNHPEQYEKRYGVIDFRTSLEPIGNVRSETSAKNIFKEILLYCDFIKGPEYGQDGLRILIGRACSFSADKYSWECWLRKRGEKKYLTVGKRSRAWFNANKIVFEPVDLILKDGEVVEDNI